MKRLSFVNFPIPFDHPYTLPSLLVAVTASSLVYYYLQNSHTADLIEAVRLRDIRKRRALKRPEDRFASLQASGFFRVALGRVYWREKCRLNDGLSTLLRSGEKCSGGKLHSSGWRAGRVTVYRLQKLWVAGSQPYYCCSLAVINVPCTRNLIGRCLSWNQTWTNSGINHLNWANPGCK